jgi:hypothetical protein
MEITFKAPYTIWLDDGMAEGERDKDQPSVEVKEGDSLHLVKGKRSKINGAKIGKVSEGTAYELMFFQMQSDDGKVCKFSK